MTRALKLMAALIFAATAGCDSKVATVNGKVTFQSKPVVFGTVSIIGPDGMTRSGPIQPDGSFSVSGVRVGEGKVAVTSLKPPDGSDGKAKRGGRDAGGHDDERTTKPEEAAPRGRAQELVPDPGQVRRPQAVGADSPGRRRQAGDDRLAIGLRSPLAKWAVNHCRLFKGPSRRRVTAPHFACGENIHQLGFPVFFVKSDVVPMLSWFLLIFKGRL